MTPQLTKTTTVLRRVPELTATFESELEDPVDRFYLVTIDPRCDDEFGHPEFITVTVEPGDKLNEEG